MYIQCCVRYASQSQPALSIFALCKCDIDGIFHALVEELPAIPQGSDPDGDEPTVFSNFNIIGILFSTESILYFCHTVKR